MKTYKKGDIVCHYQGEIIDMDEYARRVNEKVRSGNLVFSYVQMTKTLSFYYIAYSHYLFLCIVLDPDDSNDNIGKFANAACRELNETNNCYVCYEFFAILFMCYISVC